MTTQADKIAIFDADEVLLDLSSALLPFASKLIKRPATRKDLIYLMRDFNKDREKYARFGLDFMRSESFGCLNAKRGMLRLLRRLKKEGYDLAVITASSPFLEIKEKREKNLIREFGRIFTDIHSTGNLNKKDLLHQYAKAYRFTAFCDDLPATVQSSVKIVTCPIWKANEINRHQIRILDLNQVHIAHHALDILEIIIKHEKHR